MREEDSTSVDVLWVVELEQEGFARLRRETLLYRPLLRVPSQPWMLDELKREKYLDQDVAVAEIERRFGDESVYVNQSGGQSISREILGEIRKLTGDSVVWVRAEKAWRFRESFDEPGRLQN